MRDERHSQICWSQTQLKAECQCQFVDSIIITDILDDCINFVNFSSQQGINPFNHIQQLSDMLVVSTMPTDKTLTGQRLSYMLSFTIKPTPSRPTPNSTPPFVNYNCISFYCIVCVYLVCTICSGFVYSAVFLHVSVFFT